MDTFYSQMRSRLQVDSFFVEENYKATNFEALNGCRSKFKAKRFSLPGISKKPPIDDER